MIEEKHNMDIQKELKEIYTKNNDEPKTFIKNAEIYDDLLEKKKHILQVINRIQVIENLVGNKILENLNTCYIKLSPNEVFSCYDKNRNFLWSSTNKEIDKLNNSLKKIFNSELNHKYIGGNLDSLVDLSKPVKEQILKILLSKELRQIVEYNEMQMDLPTNNIKKENNKLKL